ncbi:two-component system CheB/CheR fusion protein [Rhizobium sp. PP-WC-2G-219]|nr:two-component system CheB/CheR fusion protein [Rhizobium sp. PP-WC-2G-219]
MISASPAHGGGSGPKREPAVAFPIVAIGASAGGLEACRKLLSGISSPSGMAFIFVQHLDPNHQSLIADLLKDNTRMKVMEARDEVVIERDHVYVIAPGTYLTVGDGLLHVVKAKPPHGARLPFDALLTSLADEAGSAAICIVLSGMGADGSAGLAAIKKKGGVVIVQKPEEAAYDGMPRSAIMTNLADKILTLQDMPQTIADVARTRAEAPPKPEPPEVTKSSMTLSDIIALLRSKTAHDFTSYKQGTLQRRVERRMGMNGIASSDTDRYMAILERDADERDNLAKDLLINVTSFFRDKQVFDTLKGTIIPDLVKAHQSDQPIRVWIAGCSSGEEAYSMAILFREELADTNSSVKLQIFASDVDEDAIATAREGLYPNTIKSDISADRLSRFFLKEDQGYRVAPEIRSNVVFTVQDVLADPPFSRIDMVSCRNLLIYLEPDAQAKAISLFHFALREDGVLLLGSSETAGKVEGRFETISKSNRIYRHVGRSRPGDMMFSLNSNDATRASQRSGPQAAPVKPSALADICRQRVLDMYAPAAVLINRKNECLYTMGRIGQYLAVAPGYPTSDLLAMTPQALHTKLRSAIQRCSQQKTSITASGGEIDNGHGTVKRFSVHVEPIEHNNESLFLICFIDDPAIVNARDVGTATAADAGRIQELELELEATRTELNGAISNLETSGQEQKAINEEALSFNEEYQSTNEELLTSKEELQSLNEELTALNGQLQETLERQRTTSNDLQNILYSTAVATLFLDADLNIRFFTPATKTLFHVIPGDIGRPLADLSSLAIDTTLLTDATSVLVDHVPMEHKIEARSGQWYMRRIMPYLDEDHAIEGVVITFVDVSEQRRTSEALRVAKRQADLANAAKSRFLAAASHDLRQPLQTLSLLQGLLVRRVHDEKANGLLARFEDTLGAMSGMLNALLDINQIEAGIVRADIVDFRVQTLLTMLRDELSVIAEAQGLKFLVVDCSLLVRTDPVLLEQMVRNLISNAFKYTRTGKVLVGCRRRGKSVSIEIWDTGIGIPDTELKSIFEEYHQIDNEARERSKGLGLGLSIVQRLSDLLGHRISVKSRQAKGSAFLIEVDAVDPVGKPNGSPVPDKPLLLTDRSAITGTILIVEDDAEIRSLLEQLLSDKGHTVLSAPDGPSALSLITSGRQTPDVILTDYNLPGGMNGVEVLTELRKTCRSEVPGIVLTGDISTKTLAHITGSGVIQLNKPITPNDVTAAITRLLPLNIPIANPEIANRDDATIRAQKQEKAVVYVVDDDDNLRRSLCELIEEHGILAQPYESSEAFLAHSHPEQDGCLLVDAYLPGMNGVELLQHVKQSGRQLGAIMITGKSDVQMAVDAMKAGASDFIEKPISNVDLLKIIDRSIEQSRDTTKRGAWIEKAARQIASLTVRQKEIMELVLAGHPSKNIAADLDISQRTVENHRASIMTKTGSKSLPALARLALAASEAVAAAN